jgi:hypothetical protein
MAQLWTLDEKYSASSDRRGESQTTASTARRAQYACSPSSQFSAGRMPLTTPRTAAGALRIGLGSSSKAVHGPGSFRSPRIAPPVGVDPGKPMFPGRVQIENESATLTLHVGAAILHGMHPIVRFTDSVEFPPKARQMCFLASRAPCTRSETRPRNQIHEDPRYQQQEPACGVDREDPEPAHQLSVNEPRRAEQFN